MNFERRASMKQLYEQTADINELQYEELVKPFDEKVNTYIKLSILNQYVAYYLAESYNMGTLGSNNLIALLEDATQTLAQVRSSDCNIKIIKELLLCNYSLKLKGENPVEFIEIENQK